MGFEQKLSDLSQTDKFFKAKAIALASQTTKGSYTIEIGNSKL